MFRCDPSLFIYHESPHSIFLLLYVGDIIITSNICTLITKLSFYFKIKDLKPLAYFFGIEVHRLPFSLYLSQTKYTIDLLKWTKMLGCKSISSSGTLAKLGLTTCPLLFVQLTIIVLLVFYNILPLPS